jgi:hypothetical protein
LTVPKCGEKVDEKVEDKADKSQLDKLLEKTTRLLEENARFRRDFKATKFKVEAEDGPKSILDLPEEILVFIMTFLSLPMLYGSVARVCKHFCKLTRDPAVRRNISFHRNLPIPTFAKSFVDEAHRHLTSLSLFKREDSNEIVAAATENCSNLKQLKINLCRALTKSTLDVLARSPVVANLEYVSFSHWNFGDVERVGGTLRRFLEAARNLRHLDLFACGVESEDWVRIV